MKLLAWIAALFSIAKHPSSQSASNNFKEYLQSYYLYKRNDVVDKAILFVNNTPVDNAQLGPPLIGFFGALFLEEKSVKDEFIAKINKIKNNDIRSLILGVSEVNINELYSQSDIEPAYNDMNWASYYATGNVRYIAAIVANIKYANDRGNIMLFMAGSTAKWSLCANAKQDDGVKRYLDSIKLEDKEISLILQSEPELFQNEMSAIVAEQRRRGIWN